MQGLNLVVIVALLSLTLIVLTGLLVRWWLSRLLGWRLKRRSAAADQQMTTLLLIMGTRMGRPWMIEELSAVTGLSPEALGRLLSRGRPFVQRSWEDHPKTGEEYEALRLNERGVRAYGKYAPDDMDADEERVGAVVRETDEVVDLNTFMPLVPLGPAAAQGLAAEEADFDEQPDEQPAWATGQPERTPPRRGFRHTRRREEERQNHQS